MLLRPDLLHLEELRTSDVRKALLRERAFFNAQASKGRPYLYEDVLAFAQATAPTALGAPKDDGVRGHTPAGVLPLRIYEPALARAVATGFPPAVSTGPCVCLFPIDWTTHEDAWGVPARGAAHVYRLGFTGTDTELLESAALGCAGHLAPSTDLDAPALQYLVELARDCHITYVPLVADERELDTVLQTDVPYVGFGAAAIFAGEPAERTLASLRKVRHRLPRALRAVVFLPGDATDVHVRMACDLGASVVVRPQTQSSAQPLAQPLV